MKYKTIKSALISLLLLASFNNSCYANDSFKVLKVIDGDTIYIDFNKNGIADSDERVRINGIDSFEVKPSVYLDWQMKCFNLTQKEALGLGYLGKEFAKKELLNKYVRAEYTATEKFDNNNRPLMSIYYDNGKNYEQEILKTGLAVIYPKSNLAKELEKYHNQEKLEENIKKAQNLNLSVLNKRSKMYHSLDCNYGWLARQNELIKQPKYNLMKHPASCCYENKKSYKEKRYKTFNKIVVPNAEEENIKLYFLSPLKQDKPENKCTSTACKALLYNIDHAEESIDFAIYGISKQDKIFNALVQAQKRGVKVRWVTDLSEDGNNYYSDTNRLMRKIPAYNTDFESQKREEERTSKFEYPQTAIMHDKFFIFDNKKVFTGSTNISNTCLTGYNSNVAVLIESPEIANIFSQEFEQMFNGKFHNDKLAVKNNENIKLDNIILSIYFSPINKTTKEQIIPLIKNAEHSIYIPAFYLTRNDIIEELINAKNRDIDVKIIVDETSVEGKYVNLDYIKNSGVSIKVENWKGKMHMKSIIIDESTLIIGSMNFTKQGENINDENCLIIKNAPILTSAYKAHFLKLWNSIQ